VDICSRFRLLVSGPTVPGAVRVGLDVGSPLHYEGGLQDLD
jgi:hypothetical protein